MNKERRLSALMTMMVVLGLIAMPLASAAPPTNDDFDSATVIGAIPYTDEQSTVEATTAPDDPSCAGNGKSVWYAFTPTQNMQIEANTFGSNYDTTLAAYTGSRGALNQLACNDQYNGDQSKITFNVNANETVYLMVAAYYGDGGNLKLSVSELVPVLANLTIDPVGSVVPKNGTATIRGTVTCSKPATIDLYSGLQQRSGRLLISGQGGTTLDCDGVTPWEVEITDSDGLFVGGKAQAGVNAFYWPDYEYLTVMEEIQLKPGSPKK